MSIFGDQAERLLRETWASPTELAEELYAMFGANSPLQIQGPVQLTNTTTEPALTINQLGTFDPADFPAGLTPDPPAAVSILTPGISPTPSDVAPPRIPAPSITQNKITGGTTSPGQVLSGGPGADYQVQIYPDGLGGTPKTVDVTQLSIDPAETIPPGTWAVVVQAGDSFYMQVPVWGAA